MGGKSIIAKRLGQARKLAGKLSQEALGIRAGIDVSDASARMNQYEKGKHTPKPQTVKRIGEALNIPTAYFYCEDDELADLILKFSALGMAQRERLFRFLDEL